MIVCCGEALVDMLPRLSTEGEAAFAPHAGGAVFNTAVALGRLGAPVEFFSGLSSDLFGDLLRKTLGESLVGTRFACISSRPTTLAFVRLVDGKASYAFYDENSAGRMLSVKDLPEMDGGVSAMMFGAISLIPEPCGSAYEALMTREKERRVIMLDPNIRPGFIKDRVSHLTRIRRMIAMSDIVKVSDEDLPWFGESGKPENVLRGWLEHGPKLVLLTQGAEGVLALTAKHRLFVPAQKAKVVDTVGAGDTFNAGILAYFHEAGLLSKAAIANLSPKDIEKSLKLGIKAAAVTVARAGANPPWRREIP